MKLIDKDALVAEIERRIKSILELVHPNNYDKAALQLYKGLLSFLNTLEVKDVDLEDAKKEELAQEYVDYTFKRHNIDANSREGQLIYYAFMHGMNKCLTQLRTQKGE